MMSRLLVSPVSIGLGYFIAAGFAVYYSRFGGGVATAWIASAFLAGRLESLPVRRWVRLLMACAVASTIATGLFGLGWTAALPLAAVNIAEAALAAYLSQRTSRSFQAGDTLEWVAMFYLGIGMAVPLASACVATAVLALMGKGELSHNFFHWVIGHSVGLITFLPGASLMFRRAQEPGGLRPAKGRVRVAALFLITMAALTAAVFVQDLRPLMVFPLLLVLLAAVFAGSGVALFLPVVLALVGGTLTLHGFGPVAAMDVELGDRMQFFQIYLAITVLCVLPIVCEQASRRRLIRDLQASEAHYRLLSDHTTDVVVHVGTDGLIRFASPSVQQACGQSPEALVGKSVLDLVVPGHRDRLARAHEKACGMEGRAVRVEFELDLGDSARRWFESHLRAVFDENGEPAGLVCAMRDVTHRKRLEADLSRAAMTDPLTGLPNRRAFFDAASKFAEARMETCIAAIDIDYFKKVNDRYGHAAGDAVLQAFARLARQTLRGTDTIARIGGEEFAVLLPRTNLQQAQEICERLGRAVADLVIPTDTGLVKVTISTGIAPLGVDPLDSLARADTALYRAKAAGRDQLSVAA